MVFYEQVKARFTNVTPQSFEKVTLQLCASFSASLCPQRTQRTEAHLHIIDSLKSALHDMRGDPPARRFLYLFTDRHSCLKHVRLLIEHRYA